MYYEIIDDFLPRDSFEEIRRIVLSPKIGWQYSPIITSNSHEQFDGYFVHLLIGDGIIKSEFTDNFLPKVSELMPPHYFITRAKLNLYTRQSSVIRHGAHRDADYPHHTALFYFNDTDGPTILHHPTEGEIEVECRANRIVCFDGFMQHRSTTCTNYPVRINLNINYLPALPVEMPENM